MAIALFIVEINLNKNGPYDHELRSFSQLFVESKILTKMTTVICEIRNFNKSLKLLEFIQMPKSFGKSIRWVKILCSCTRGMN